LRLLLVITLTLVLTGCQDDKKPIMGDTPFQRKMNADFKDATTTPLKATDLKDFEGLEFFDFDETFKVDAVLKRTPDSEWFQMKTTTDRLSKERVFGIVTFTLKNQEYQLKVYQGEENMNTPGFEDYLFLPFLDLSNGETTYSGGRYIDLSIPEGNRMEIDFNKAYNPLCVYNEKYSCPIVPRENFLEVKVEAGVKMYQKKVL